MKKQTPFTLVYNAMDEIDANLVQGFLQSHNIIAEIAGGGAAVGSGSIDPSVSTRVAKGIYVPKAHAKKAKQLIKNRK